MQYFVLTYDFVDDFLARRAEYRQAHLQLVREAHERGELPLAGALGDPPDGALLVFHTSSAARAEEFAKRDPYVINGLATRWRVRPWSVVTVAGGPAGKQA
jgi:uncharacterized protein